MNRPVQLLFGVHAHQPVGNFPTVIRDAHEKSYRPFLATVARYPTFKFAIHFSGWLMQTLESMFPEDMALLREMVARGQAELVGGGFAEPVLAAIPHRDRCAQLAAMNQQLARYGAHPCGAWLTERVWEASVVPALVASGLKYVMVDDYHFLCTGVAATCLDGYYLTEEEGQRIKLFPIAEGLRYRLPFAPAADAVGYLESLAATAQAAAIYFDDIEKFGVWPETYEWVYTRGWLVDFIERVLASPAIAVTHYRDFQAVDRPRGLVYLPTASYSEMNEWTLPAPAAKQYADMVARAKTNARLTEERPFLRGGIWRNFLSRYAESNWMHKRMLQLSNRLAAQPAHPSLTELTRSLHLAQANDAYWHGLFGGLYLPHLRRAIWRELITLEQALGGCDDSGDLDCDGYPEYFLREAQHLAVIRDDGLGGVHEWSSFLHRHNFGDTLRRYAEHYHAVAVAGSPERGADADGIASAHDRVAFKHALDPANFTPDRHGRLLFTDAWAQHDEWREIDDYRLTQRDAVSIEFMAETGSGIFHKKIAVTAQSLVVCYPAVSAATVRRTELHLALPSCDGFGGRYRLEDGTIPCGFGQPLVQATARVLWLEDSELGGRLRLEVTEPVTLTAEPFHTVSQSEAGFEQIMQAAKLVLQWPASRDQRITLTLE